MNTTTKKFSYMVQSAGRAGSPLRAVRKQCGNLPISRPAKLAETDSYTHFRPRGANGESQRDSVAKPRVARNELPWEFVRAAIYPEGVTAPRCQALTQPLRGRCSSTTPTQGSFVPRNPGLNDPIPLGLKIRIKSSSRRARSDAP